MHLVQLWEEGYHMLDSKEMNAEHGQSASTPVSFWRDLKSGCSSVLHVHNVISVQRGCWVEQWKAPALLNPRNRSCPSADCERTCSIGWSH